MSFYQPSWSLYDVLNALSNQGQAQYPQDQLHELQRRHAEAEAQRRADRAASRRSPFYSRFDSTPGSYYRGIPGDQYYYRPDFYQYSDEEGDDDDYEGLEEEEYPQQRPKVTGPYVRGPSYYHGRGPRAGNVPSGQSDPLQDLLGALLGAAPSGENTADESSEQKQDIKLPLQQEAKNGEPEPEKTKQETETTSEQHEPQAAAQPAAKKKPLARSRSFVSNPLQVSKPETRLDLPFSPEANVYDCPDAYVVVVALPGATSKAFKVDYHPSSHEMIIKGNVSDKLNLDEKFLKITELKYGAFQRTVKFPVLPRIKDDEIKATYNNGLLQVKVPKLSDGSDKPAPKKRIVIEEIPDEELAFEENPNPVQE